ncbi:MAG TPA: hypothetical protein VF677_05830 [Flavobacterium sp.]|jgi:rubredoxin
MGQIANDMVNGFSCSECGIYFEKAHGYPVLCEYCFEDIDQDDECFLPRATEEEL